MINTMFASMIEQQKITNEILFNTGQFSQTTAAAVCKVAEDEKYAKPAYNLIDKRVNKIIAEWKADIKNSMDAFETHSLLSDKYNQTEDWLHPHFQKESRFPWPLPKKYLAIAEQQDIGDQVMAISPDYDAELEWRQMRERHARECMNWVKAHQAKCVEFFQNEIQKVNIAQNLYDRLEIWAMEFLPDAKSMRFHKEQANIIIDEFYRTVIPEVKSRIKKDREKKEKRITALAEAEAERQATDPQQLQALAMIEALRSQTKGKQDGKKKQIILPTEGAIHFLLKDATPDVLKQAGITFNQNSTRSPRPSRSNSNTTARNRSRNRSRSSSRHSSRSSKGKGKKNRKGKGKGKNKGKNNTMEKQPKSILKKVSFTSEVDKPKPSKGKGKGKSSARGKSPSKGKGRNHSKN